MNRKPVRDGFFHHESVRREDLCKLIRDPTSIDGFLVARELTLHLSRQLFVFHNGRAKSPRAVPRRRCLSIFVF